MVPFPGSRARKQDSPRLVTGAKRDLSWCPVLEPFSGCFPRLQGGVLESFRMVLGPLFLVSDRRFVQSVNKCALRLFLWSEEQRSSIAKPCKPYSTSFKNRRCASDGLGPPQCVPKAFILFWRVPNGTQHLCSLARDIKSSF